MKKMLKVIAAILAGVGALNWGLVGLFGFNLVTTLVGSGVTSTIVYVLVGVSGGKLLFDQVKQ